MEISGRRLMFLTVVLNGNTSHCNILFYNTIKLRSILGLSLFRSVSKLAILATGSEQLANSVVIAKIE